MATPELRLYQRFDVYGKPEVARSDVRTADRYRDLPMAREMREDRKKAKARIAARQKFLRNESTKGGD